MSAAIFLREKPEAKVHFVDYGSAGISQFVRQLQFEKETVTQVIVADFGMDEHNSSLIVTALEELRKAKVQVDWLDHHVWTEESMKKVRDLGVKLTKVPDRDACGAELVYHAYREGDGFASLLAKMAHSTDFHGTVDDVTSSLVQLIDYYNSLEPEECDSRLEMLARSVARGVIIEQGTYMDYLSYLDIQGRGVDMLKQSIVVLNAGNLRVAVGFAENSLSGTRACEVIREVVQSDIQVAVKGRKLSIRRSNEAVDCSKIARALNGGGHDYAAGGELPFDASEPDNREAASRMIIEKVSEALAD